MKKLKKTARITLFLLLFAFLAVTALDLTVVLSARPHFADVQTAPAGDCILILGAGLRRDGTPSLMLRDRLDTGIALYNAGKADAILVSGDHGRETYDEVNAMKDYLVQGGVPADCVYQDHAGFSTYETMARARKIFALERPLIVTQEYHLYRAVFLARSFGLDASGVPADRVAYRGQLFRELREIVARAKDVFSALFKPAPTYLGDPIPIAASPASATAG